MTATASEALPNVTVAIVTRGRAQVLARALIGVSQIDYPTYEIVVVGDLPAIKDCDVPDWIARQVRYVRFDEANICAARNHAIRVASGEIIAFLDDDAVPEPTWLRELVRPFSTPAIAAVSGCVRDVDGIAFEWCGGLFDRSADEYPLSETSDIVTLSASDQTSADRYLALRGVNVAFCRDALMEIGGFDEAIRYYLDETDVAIRLAGAGHHAAFTRRAEVHHLRMPNAQRGHLQMPGNQHEIGAAKGFFCAQHLSEKDRPAALRRFRARRCAELDPQMRLGVVRTSDRDRVDAELAAGWAEGVQRKSTRLSVSEAPAAKFTPFDAPPQRLRMALTTGWGVAAIRRARRFAAALARLGHVVSCFSPVSGPWPQRVAFENGVWMHTGGTWTLPVRDTDGLMALGRAARARAEMQRVAATRPPDVALTSLSRARKTECTAISVSPSGAALALSLREENAAQERQIRELLQSVAESDIEAAYRASSVDSAQDARV
ncbi:MAG: glycosyltransferase [Pseudomonadota bacterium]